ncbi:MAG: UDP-glucose 4-epimerase [Clostridiales bacterium]|nr:MAG: UDP-glucose 4-epimerase [Clostridiales bacterium]
MKMKLITGALGQIGTELIAALSDKYGAASVIATDLVDQPDLNCRYEKLDVTDLKAFQALFSKYQIDEVYHLASILSAKGEANPDLLWRVNMGGLQNVLDLARQYQFKLFNPSSIAAFGPSTPADDTPQVTIQRPTTIYGVSKVTGELLADYYFAKYGVDVRGLRFPGLISNKQLPGGGTTDYAVHIYYEALKSGRYTSYIGAGTYLDMLYMPDAIKGIIDLMAADGTKLKNRNAYNITAMSIDPEAIAKSIKKQLPHFQLDYDVDPVRQAIAESWPNKLDDSAARAEWQWQPAYDLDKMTEDMLSKLAKKMERSKHEQ